MSKISIIEKFIKDNFSIDKTVFIAVMPLVGYILAFTYQSGQFYIFNIPLSLVQPTIFHIVLSSLIITTILVLIFFLVEFLFPLLSNPLSKDIFLIFIINIFLILVFIFLLPSFLFIVPILLLGALDILFITTLLRLINQYPEEKNYFKKYILYKEKVKKEESLNKKKVKDDESFIKAILQSPYRAYISLGILIVIFTFISYIFGQWSVRNVNTFPIVNYKNKSYIFAGHSKDNLLLVPVNIKKRQIEDYFLLLPVTKIIKVQYIQTGQLKIEKNYLKNDNPQMYTFE